MWLLMPGLLVWLLLWSARRLEKSIRLTAGLLYQRGAYRIEVEVFALAEELLKRIGDFIKRFDKVGTAIDNLKGSYDEAYKKAYTGRQSVVQKANEIKELGVKESSLSPLKETENQLFNDDGKE